MNTEQKPEALQPAEKLRDAINRIELGFSDAIATNDLRLAAMELESLHTRVQELEAKEAKSAAPVVLPEPVAAQSRFIASPPNFWSWCTVGHARSFVGGPYEVRYLFTEQQVRELLAQATCHQAQPVKQEPFGYFKPFVDGWMDCKETDEGARPLYEAPQPQADALDALDALTPAAVAEPVAWTVGGEVTNWSEDFSKYKTQHYVRPVFSTPIKDADALDAERYRRVRRGQRWSVVDGIGNELRAECLDAAIDAAIAAAKEKP